jgi:hypothetical protein
MPSIFLPFRISKSFSPSSGTSCSGRAELDKKTSRRFLLSFFSSHAAARLLFSFFPGNGTFVCLPQRTLTNLRECRNLRYKVNPPPLFFYRVLLCFGMRERKRERESTRQHTARPTQGKINIRQTPQDNKTQGTTSQGKGR